MELKVENVSKIYSNGQQALDEFTLTFSTGVTGLLGPNGAGKSTLMRIIATIAQPTAGTVMLDGVDVIEHPENMRNILGYLPQEFGVYPKLTARQYLQYIGALKGLKSIELNNRIEDLLELVNLDYVEEEKKLSEYSGGMKQRVGIAQALLNNPKILIVDEPTVGLDPQERSRFSRLLAEMSDDRIIILSTHIVSDVEATAEHVALIKNGKQIIDARPDQIIKQIHGFVFEDTVTQEEYKNLQTNYFVTATKRQMDGIYVRYIKKEEQEPFNNSTVVRPNLEEAYLYYTNN